jgi:hypothetical protein
LSWCVIYIYEIILQISNQQQQHQEMI